MRKGGQLAAAMAAAMAAATMLGLAGCDLSGPALGGYDIPVSAEAEAAPWPSLADAPAALPEGVYTAEAPNPVEGLLAREALSAEAAASAARANELAAPVAAAVDWRVAASQARARALSGPVLSEDDRRRLLQR